MNLPSISTARALGTPMSKAMMAFFADVIGDLQVERLAAREPRRAECRLTVAETA